MPTLSLIVIVYDMPRQAMNTLYSLSARHQRNVQEADYEIVVVENRSPHTLDPAAVAQLGCNIRYTLRDEAGVSPAAAINEGLRQAQGRCIGLMIDGARMITPRVVEYALMAHRMAEHSLLAIPSFNLGFQLQHHHLDTGYNEAIEQQLLQQTRWQDNGYRLYDISCIGEANPRGVFQSFMESNCYFSSRQNFTAIGGADETFQYPGGGGLNLHMFRALGMLVHSNPYFITPGEGSFHQFHGGVSTSQREDRETMLVPPRIQLESHWGGQPFQALEREPTLLGAVSQHAQPFLHYSAQRGWKRLNRLHKQTQPFWRDDHHHTRYTEQAS